ncbi:hypothetical protein EDC39_11242 [Geothermobacter ehrlichii]|uniref:Uncharacterized protein n=1 Tax=Geothermobacter ehrlichii TaxID=213224 RepID=A0A5D3WJJ0_9BACT|nr:hypothetical protein EDC39_11242 [Geothermobacter ehrlichii]
MGYMVIAGVVLVLFGVVVIIRDKIVDRRQKHQK